MELEVSGRSSVPGDFTFCLFPLAFLLVLFLHPQGSSLLTPPSHPLIPSFFLLLCRRFHLLSALPPFRSQMSSVNSLPPPCLLLSILFSLLPSSSLTSSPPSFTFLHPLPSISLFSFPFIFLFTLHALLSFFLTISHSSCLPTPEASTFNTSSLSSWLPLLSLPHSFFSSSSCTARHDVGPDQGTVLPGVAGIESNALECNSSRDPEEEEEVVVVEKEEKKKEEEEWGMVESKYFHLLLHSLLFLLWTFSFLICLFSLTSLFFLHLSLFLKVGVRNCSSSVHHVALCVCSDLSPVFCFSECASLTLKLFLIYSSLSLSRCCVCSSALSDRGCCVVFTSRRSYCTASCLFVWLLAM